MKDKIREIYYNITDSLGIDPLILGTIIVFIIVIFNIRDMKNWKNLETYWKIQIIFNILGLIALIWAIIIIKFD